MRLANHPVLPSLPERRRVTLSFEGSPVEGYEGEPIAVALWAAGIRTLRYADDSGGARGMFCGIGHCFECRAVVDDVVEVRTCITPLRTGMRVKRVTGRVKPVAEES